MRRLLPFSALLLARNLSANFAPTQNGATTTVTANPATITVGSSVGLAATFQPNNVRATPLLSPAGRSPSWTESLTWCSAAADWHSATVTVLSLWERHYSPSPQAPMLIPSHRWTSQVTLYRPSSFCRCQSRHRPKPSLHRRPAAPPRCR
jgi:hypothetical protein